MEERERDNWIPRTPGHLLRELRRRCPQLFVDESAPAERRIVITDDFGQRVEMSADQFGPWSRRPKPVTSTQPSPRDGHWSGDRVSRARASRRARPPKRPTLRDP